MLNVIIKFGVVLFFRRVHFNENPCFVFVSAVAFVVLLRRSECIRSKRFPYSVE